MKKCQFIAAIALLIFATSCSSLVSVVKEKPSSPKITSAKTIYVGWLDLPADKWQDFGYDSKSIWVNQINENNKGIVLYLNEHLPGRNYKNTRTKPANGDIYISLSYFSFTKTYKVTPSGMDEIKVGVEFIDIKSGKSLYKAVVIVTGSGRFPRNWKGTTFDGRVDNMMYNLAGFIASKF